MKQHWDHNDPDCPKCHGTGIIEGQTFQVIPDQPGAVWFKNNDRVCDCVPVIEIRVP